MEKVYVNLVPIKSGGGLQNAINLIDGFDKINSHDYKFIVRNKTLAKLLKERGMDFEIVKDSFQSRLKYELFFYSNKRNATIFTLFGGRPLLCYGNKTISGCAYSNLFYPEIDFWGHLSFFKKLKKQAIDIYRFIMIKKSNEIIFETEVLKQRAEKLKGFKIKKLHVVKMAVNKIITKEVERATNSSYNLPSSKSKILYLGSSHPNKRQHKLVDIAQSMVNKGEINFRFITTMSDNDYYTQFEKSVHSKNLQEYFINLGTIESSEVGGLIKESDAMINIAALESFSNNFIEAWSFNKLLFVTDADWARSSCLNAAVYIDPLDSDRAALKIIEVLNDEKKQNDIIKQYPEILNNYNDYITKAYEYKKIIKGEKNSR
ncbi:glycosyltransferase [Sporosarcina sp. Marseille-Q4063]|uniref:glycosyltransferase n=1 Tax=Sporosarcina sp. Marseille-Q4063 TaxID=2810514 RepID=UPI001BAF3818|nr:glycosyltransferase [Sporosarcina sp. Marseille-Q4063]QUW21247.1 glycosyltransferase [Sporosarcina sp. Marseille-Q4063]